MPEHSQKWRYCELQVHIKDYEDRRENPYAKGYNPRDPYTAFVLVNYYTLQGLKQEVLIESEIQEDRAVIFEARRLLPKALARMGSQGWEIVHVVYDGVQPSYFILKMPIHESP